MEGRTIFNYRNTTTLIGAFFCLLFMTQAGLAQGTAVVQDTLNQVDENGRRQGYWRIVAPVKDKPEHADGSLVEEGRYENGRRSGLWIRYWPNGKPKSEVHYTMGRPRGDYKTYHSNGNLEEQGTWDLDRNTGNFQRYHANGNVAQEFVFDEHGTRNGKQKYFHENGRLAVEVTIRDGREEGLLRRYDREGNMVQEALFAGGDIDEANSRWIVPTPRSADVKPEPDAPLAPAVGRDEQPNIDVFREDGHNTLYDKELRISMRGEFRKGRLWDGRRYRYNTDGILYRIELYREGRYIGDAPIAEDEL